MNARQTWRGILAGAVLTAAGASGQGPASCGFHLDIRSNETSTHSAVADMPNAPGSGWIPFVPGAAGNPYTAYATPGSPIAITVSGNALAYGPSPIGAGSCVTLLYSIGAPMIPVVLGPPFVAPCAGAAEPTVFGVLPITGAIIDSCGIVSPPPPFGFFDPGSGRFVFTGTYPAFAPPSVNFQAAGVTPGGQIWLTNAVTLVAGPNPSETPVAPFVACDAAVPATDDGSSLGNPTPPGFTFYGYSAPSVDIDVNGFADFAPGNGGGAATAPFQACDTNGTSGDMACSPPIIGQSRPKIDVNHSDYHIGVTPQAPFSSSITMETRPAGPFWPEAVIYRWKNIGGGSNIAGLSTAALVLELQGVSCGGCVPPVVPSRIVVVRAWLPGQVDQCGITPGPGGGLFPPYPAAPTGSTTCTLGAAGLAFMSTFGPPSGVPFTGVPAGVIHMDSSTASAAVGNSAIVFTPTMLAPPDAYSLVVY